MWVLFPAPQIVAIPIEQSKTGKKERPRRKMVSNEIKGDISNLVRQLYFEEFGHLPDKQIRIAIECAISKQLLGFTSYRQYIEEMQAAGAKTLTKALRSACKQDHTILFNYKMALFDCFYENRVSKASFRKFKIAPKRYIARAIMAEPRFRKEWHVKVKAALFVLPNLVDYQKKCSQLLKLAKTFMRVFVHTKMRFVYTSNSMSPDDLIQELMAKAVEVFYSCAPYKSEQHILNAIKASVKNEGINLIKFYTAAKRQRLMGNPEVNHLVTTNRIVSMHITDTTSMNCEDEYQILSKSWSEEGLHSLDDESSGKEIALMELVSDFKKIKENLSPTHSKALDLLHLSDDPDFSKLSAKLMNIGRNKDSESIYRMVGPKTYQKLVRNYLGISKRDMRSLIDNIKKQLGGRPQ